MEKLELDSAILLRLIKKKERRIEDKADEREENAVKRGFWSTLTATFAAPLILAFLIPWLRETLSRYVGCHATLSLR